MSGAFNVEVRALICSHCGASLPFVPAGGGQIQCQYCRSVTMVTPRDDRSLSRGPVDERQRVAQLWSQLQSGMQVHPELPALMENGLLPERNVATAMKMWEDTRRRQAVDPAAVGDDLLWLTTALSGRFTDDRLRFRALWESALEACPQPRHRQFIRCALCRAAVKDGDLNAAQAWLGPCDPQPQDLLCDTAYRASYAYMATARGHFDHVLQALGMTTDAFPLFFAQRVFCHVLRANAFEKRGDVETATAQLRAVVAAEQGLAAVLPTMLMANAFLQLCPQSMARALGR